MKNIKTNIKYCLGFFSLLFLFNSIENFAAKKVSELEKNNNETNNSEIGVVSKTQDVKKEKTRKNNIYYSLGDLSFKFSDNNINYKMTRKLKKSFYSNKTDQQEDEENAKLEKHQYIKQKISTDLFQPGLKSNFNIKFKNFKIKNQLNLSKKGEFLKSGFQSYFVSGKKLILLCLPIKKGINNSALEDKFSNNAFKRVSALRGYKSHYMLSISNNFQHKKTPITNIFNIIVNETDFIYFGKDLDQGPYGLSYNKKKFKEKKLLIQGKFLTNIKNKKIPFVFEIGSNSFFPKRKNGNHIFELGFATQIPKFNLRKNISLSITFFGNFKNISKTLIDETFLLFGFFGSSFDLEIKQNNMTHSFSFSPKIGKHDIEDDLVKEQIDINIDNIIKKEKIFYENFLQKTFLSINLSYGFQMGDFKIQFKTSLGFLLNKVNVDDNTGSPNKCFFLENIELKLSKNKIINDSKYVINNKKNRLRIEKYQKIIQDK